MGHIDFSGDPDHYCKETLYFCDFSGGGGGVQIPCPPPPPLDPPMCLTYFVCCIYLLLLLNMTEMAHDWIYKKKKGFYSFQTFISYAYTMINKISFFFSQGPEATVHRHCWNMTTDVSYTPSGCEEYDWTEICYCSDVNRPCNRVGHLLMSPWLMAIMTVSCFVTIMLR